MTPTPDQAEQENERLRKIGSDVVKQTFNQAYFEEAGQNE